MHFQPSIGSIARGAVDVEVGECVDLGGDGVPVESGELAGLVPAAGVVRQDGAFLVPGHFPDGEHGFDVCWHDVSFRRDCFGGD